jgi:hypothetical protein
MKALNKYIDEDELKEKDFFSNICDFVVSNANPVDTPEPCGVSEDGFLLTEALTHNFFITAITDTSLEALSAVNQFIQDEQLQHQFMNRTYGSINSTMNVMR